LRWQHLAGSESQRWGTHAKLEIEPDSLPQQVHVGRARIRNKAPPSARFQQSETARNGQAGLLRYVPGPPFIQQSLIGREGFRQEDCAALTGAESFAFFLQRWLCRPTKCCHLNPSRIADFLCTWKPTTGD
jgi:hypothetical protein